MRDPSTEIISKYLAEEESNGRIHKVKGGESRVQCSPFGVIPKKGNTGKWRLIVNLLAPTEASVNDGMDKELASVAYTSVDEVARRVMSLCRRLGMPLDEKKRKVHQKLSRFWASR